MRGIGIALVHIHIYCSSVADREQKYVDHQARPREPLVARLPASRQALSRPPLLAHSSTGQPRLLFATFRRTEFTVRLGVGRSYNFRFWSGWCALGGVVTRQGSRSVHRCSRRSATTRRTSPACVAGDRSSHRLAHALKIVSLRASSTRTMFLPLLSPSSSSAAQ